MKKRLDARGRVIYPLICQSSQLSTELMKHFDFFTGVPDSMINKVLTDLKPYHFAARENHALAMAFGARLGGAKPCILIQNSGLGLIGDAVFGLLNLYNTGVVFVITLRGELEWEEIQHKDWGKKTHKFISMLEFETYDFQKIGLNSVSMASEKAFIHNKPAVILLHRGNIDE